MLKLLLIFALLAPLKTIASRGTEGGGGGDPCENRIKIVRDDIKSWILKGGAQGLKLPAGKTLDLYNKNMIAAIDNTKIKCVSQNDKGYPVEVNGTPKVCKYQRSFNNYSITCDYQKFQALPESDQYVLIHHEYAGISDIENPNYDDSVYEVSNQISEYLVDQVVKRLAVKPAQPKPPTKPNNIKSGYIYVSGISDCGYIVNNKGEDNMLVLERTTNPNYDSYNCFDENLGGIYSCVGNICTAMNSYDTGYNTVYYRVLEITYGGNLIQKTLCKSKYSDEVTNCGETKIKYWTPTDFTKPPVPTYFSAMENVECPFTDEENKSIKNRLLAEALEKCSWFHEICKMVPKTYLVKVKVKPRCYASISVQGGK